LSGTKGQPFAVIQRRCFHLSREMTWTTHPRENSRASASHRILSSEVDALAGTSQAQDSSHRGRAWRRVERTSRARSGTIPASLRLIGVASGTQLPISWTMSTSRCSIEVTSMRKRSAVARSQSTDVTHQWMEGRVVQCKRGMGSMWMVKAVGPHGVCEAWAPGAWVMDHRRAKTKLTKS